MLPVKGYTPQTDDRVIEVNTNKALEEEVLQRIDGLLRWEEDGVPAGWGTRNRVCDARWLGIARTHIEQGFMAMNRAIFRPERAKLS